MAILMKKPVDILMPMVNTTHFHAITLKAQTYLLVLHQGKLGFWYYDYNHCMHCRGDKSCCCLGPDSQDGVDCQCCSLQVSRDIIGTGGPKLTSLSSHPHFIKRG